jgi:hypothetical protein
MSRAVNEEILKSALEFCDGRKKSGDITAFDDGRSWSSCGCRLDDSLSDRFTIDDWADGRVLDFLVFDSSWLGSNRFLDSDLQAKLAFGSRSSVKLLVDGDVGRVELDETSGGIGIALKDCLGRGRDREQESQLVGKSGGIQVLERKLESTVCAIDIDLQSDHSIPVGGSCGGHREAVLVSAYELER